MDEYLGYAIQTSKGINGNKPIKLRSYAGGEVAVPISETFECEPLIEDRARLIQ